MGFITFIGAMFVVYFSKGLTALDTFDFWMANVLIFILAIFQTLAFGWWFGIEKGLAELQRGSQLKLPWFLKYMIKYIAPVYLIAVCLAWIVQYSPGYIKKIQSDPVVQISIGFIFFVFAFFGVVTFLAIKKWERKEKIESELGGSEDGHLVTYDEGDI